jgi:hypothetical protein
MPVRIRVLVLATLLVLTACGSSGQHDVTAEPSISTTPSSTGGPMPTTVPAAAGTVTSKVPVTILDDGGGAELCLGGVMDSYPPQCGGPRLTDWTWADHRGDFEEANGVQWGEFVVTGTFDGKAFTLTRAVPADEYDGGTVESDTDFSTPCGEPDGGWRVLDPTRTTDETMQAAFEHASRLPGYAEAWMDQSRNLADGQDDTGEAMNDPAYVTINVRVTRDVGGAETELRKVWGGALCVSKAKHTEAELHRIQNELQDLPGMLGSGPARDLVDAYVIHDDGSLQAWADATYGAGLVRISSALVPA